MAFIKYLNVNSEKYTHFGLLIRFYKICIYENVYHFDCWHNAGIMLAHGTSINGSKDSQKAVEFKRDTFSDTRIQDAPTTLKKILIKLSCSGTLRFQKNRVYF